MKTEGAFWDTSAIVPLCCHQSSSNTVRRLLREGTRVVAWWGTTVEARSALARLLREAVFTQQEFEQALAKLAVLRRSWCEVQPVEQVRGLAELMLDRYDLRSGDALQLAAALIACNEKPRSRGFVCLDDRLSAAASGAGFKVLPKR